MLPPMIKPRIIDIGCGSGVPTLELARLSGGEITCIDIDQKILEVLRGKIEKSGLSGRVKVLSRSLFDVGFPDESFDIVWAEGSINVIGFQKGLQEWKRLLKPGGFMVVHDESRDVGKKLKQISSCGYELLGYFEVDTVAWRTEYFLPLEKLVEQAQVKYQDTPVISEAIQDARHDIDMFKKHPERNSSACFVMQKR